MEEELLQTTAQDEETIPHIEEHMPNPELVIFDGRIQDVTDWNLLMEHLDKTLDTNIVGYMCKELWNGKQERAYPLFPKTLSILMSNLSVSDGTLVWKINEDNDLIAINEHHDGTNFMIFRAAKNVLTKEELIEKVSDIMQCKVMLPDGGIEEHLQGFTDPLGDTVREMLKLNIDIAVTTDIDNDEETITDNNEEE